MSNVSIYGKKWIDLVFEGKNKSYGAYQLRQESGKTTLAAFFIGLLFIGSLSGAGMLLSSFGKKPTESAPAKYDDPVIVSTVHLIEHPPVAPKKTVTVLKKSQTEIKQKDLVNPTIAKHTDAYDDVTKNSDLKTNQPNQNQGSNSGVDLPDGGENSGGGTAVVPAEVPSNVPVVAAVLDKLPVFPGGIEKFYKYVGNNFEKPELDEQKTIKILVAFVIEKDGSMTDIRVLRNPGYGLDKEAIRVLKALKTKWEPGIMNGKAVRTAYNLPITVQMQ